jgi:DNA-binding winged helix-turn-helix (wHTH) protein
MPDQTPASGAETVIYRFDDCVLDTERRELRRADALRAVEPQVFDLLEYLMRHRERVVGRDELLKAIWRGHEVSDAVLSTRINAARAAIGDSGRDQNVIRTFLRKGFRFVRPVRERKADVDEQISTTPSRPRLALAIAGAPAIAVLPFAHLGTGPSTACVAHGLAEEIGVTVSKLGWLSVVYRHASLPSNRSQMEVQQLASALGVQYVLEGGVREAAGRVRIIVRLVDGEDDSGPALCGRVRRGQADTNRQSQSVAVPGACPVPDEYATESRSRHRRTSSEKSHCDRSELRSGVEPSLLRRDLARASGLAAPIGGPAHRTGGGAQGARIEFG